VSIVRLPLLGGTLPAAFVRDNPRVLIRAVDPAWSARLPTFRRGAKALGDANGTSIRFVRPWFPPNGTFRQSRGLAHNHARFRNHRRVDIRVHDQARVGHSTQSSIPPPSERHNCNSKCPRDRSKPGGQLLGLSIGGFQA